MTKTKTANLKPPETPLCRFLRRFRHLKWVAIAEAAKIDKRRFYAIVHGAVYASPNEASAICAWLSRNTEETVSPDDFWESGS